METGVGKIPAALPSPWAGKLQINFNLERRLTEAQAGVAGKWD